MWRKGCSSRHTHNGMVDPWGAAVSSGSLSVRTAELHILLAPSPSCVWVEDMGEG